MSVCTVAGWTIGVLFPAGARNLSLLHIVQTGSEAHPTSYPLLIGRGAIYPGIKRPGSVNLTINFHSSEVKIVEIYLHFLICLHGMVLN
jgi:hypothetical protein